MFYLVFEIKELFVSLQPNVWLRWGLDLNVAFYIKSKLNLPTCDSFPLIVSHIGKIKFVKNGNLVNTYGYELLCRRQTPVAPVSISYQYRDWPASLLHGAISFLRDRGRQDLGLSLDCVFVFLQYCLYNGVKLRMRSSVKIHMCMRASILSLTWQTRPFPWHLTVPLTMR